jgi:hypothetical protein
VIHVRDITKQIFAFAILHREKVDNPANAIGSASVVTFAHGSLFQRFRAA